MWDVASVTSPVCPLLDRGDRDACHDMHVSPATFPGRAQLQGIQQRTWPTSSSIVASRPRPAGAEGPYEESAEGTGPSVGNRTTLVAAGICA